MSQSIKLVALLTIFLTADPISSLLANEDLAANLASSQVELSSGKTNCCRKICHHRISFRMAMRRNAVCTDAVACEQDVQEINEVAAQDDLDSLTQDISYESDVAEPQSKINPADGDEALRNDAQTPGDDIDKTDTETDTFQTTEVLGAADDVRQDPRTQEAKQIIQYEQEMDLDASTFEGVVEQSDENEKNDSEEYYSTEEDTEEDYSSEEADTEQYDTDEYDTEEYDSERYGNEDLETQPEGTKGDLENQDFVDPVSGNEGTSDESTPEETRDSEADIQDEIDQNAPQQEPYPADEYPIDQVPYAADEEDDPLEESRSLPKLSIDPNLVKLIANWQSLSPETQREILELVRKDVQRVASVQAGLND